MWTVHMKARQALTNMHNCSKNWKKSPSPCRVQESNDWPPNIQSSVWTTSHELLSPLQSSVSKRYSKAQYISLHYPELGCALSMAIPPPPPPPVQLQLTSLLLLIPLTVSSLLQVNVCVCVCVCTRDYIREERGGYVWWIHVNEYHAFWCWLFLSWVWNVRTLNSFEKGALRPHCYYY